ncbi:hypothetical protein C0J52_24062, partial [Blattella germanica]
KDELEEELLKLKGSTNEDTGFTSLRDLSRVLFSNEACFMSDGYYSSRNSHIWDYTNPYGITARNCIIPEHFNAKAQITIDDEDRWFERVGYVAWPGHSPDLTSFDFFPLRYVYVTILATRAQLIDILNAAFDDVKQNRVHHKLEKQQKKYKRVGGLEKEDKTRKNEAVAIITIIWCRPFVLSPDAAFLMENLALSLGKKATRFGTRCDQV